MYELIDSGSTPPCGWNYEVRETGVTVEADSFDRLLLAVEDNLELNHIAFDRRILSPMIMNDLCERSPTGICKGFINWFVTRPRAVMNGTNALAMMITRGKGAFVSQARAEERAAICGACRYNVENPGCMTCKGFKSIINGARRGRTTTLDGELNTCGICKCFLMALVHVDKEILKATTSKEMLRYYPSHCWKKQEITGDQDATVEQAK